MPPRIITSAMRKEATDAIHVLIPGMQPTDDQIRAFHDRKEKDKVKDAADKKLDDAKKKEEQKKAAEEKKKSDAEAAKKKAEEDAQKKIEDDQKAADDAKKTADDDAAKKADDGKKRADEDAKKKTADEKKKAEDDRAAAKRAREADDDMDGLQSAARIFRQKRDIMEIMFGKDWMTLPIGGVWEATCIYIIKMLGGGNFSPKYAAIQARWKSLEERDTARVQFIMSLLSVMTVAGPLDLAGRDLEILAEMLAIAILGNECAARHNLRFVLNILLRREKLLSWTEKDLRETETPSDLTMYMNAKVPGSGTQSELWRFGDAVVIAVGVGGGNGGGGGDGYGGGGGGGYGGGGVARGGGGGGRGGGRGGGGGGPFNILYALSEAKRRVPAYVPVWDPQPHECSRCGGTGHRANVCRAVMKCFGCGRTGHAATTCATNKM